MLGTVQYHYDIMSVVHMNGMCYLVNRVIKGQFYKGVMGSPFVKRVYQKIIFLISQPKHTLWVLKRTISTRRFF